MTNEERIAELEAMVACLTETIAIHTKIIDTLQKYVLNQIERTDSNENETLPSMRQ